ncbi:hypothetical protein EVAR_25459_1 [Eumeta japonica]|uniref:Uncharacterized protein n=1 Tax=Eumeta variegata TaxID=151549 RepID=A0A4C1VKX2_EUMVA|nr:hypothetical protein EVAR_25459_1 [Eumeta japonica]
MGDGLTPEVRWNPNTYALPSVNPDHTWLRERWMDDNKEIVSKIDTTVREFWELVIYNRLVWCFIAISSSKSSEIPEYRIVSDQLLSRLSFSTDVKLSVCLARTDRGALRPRTPAVNFRSVSVRRALTAVTSNKKRLVAASARVNARSSPPSCPRAPPALAAAAEVRDRAQRRAAFVRLERRARAGAAGSGAGVSLAAMSERAGAGPSSLSLTFSSSIFPYA